VDLATAMPEAPGRFSGVGGALVSEDGSVAFAGCHDVLRRRDCGHRARQGLYVHADEELSRIADTRTAIPDAAGVFSGLNAVAMSGRTLLFYGIGASGRGLYLSSGGGLVRVVDTNTPIPEGTGNFTDFEVLLPWVAFSRPASPALSKEYVAFRGFGIGGREGIYLFDGFEVRRVADTSTAIPGGAGIFGSLSFPGVDDSGRVVFYGRSASGDEGGIYLLQGSELRRIADLKTSVPGADRTFTQFGPPAISGGKIVFKGFGQCCDEDGNHLQHGIYIATPTP
jgi:hypothetical protein